MSNIHQEVTFPAPPPWVYEALVDPQRFAAITGAPATGSSTEGAAFSAFGGHVAGRHVELVPNRRIVQAWRERTWPEGVYSIVRFELQSQPDLSIYGEGTKLVLDHEGFPLGAKEHLESGWRERYWHRILSQFC